MKPECPGERIAQDERRQVNQPDRVDRVDGMLAMGGQPVEVLGAVVDRMEPPEEIDPVLQAMAPVNEEVAEHEDDERLCPKRQRGEVCLQPGGHEPLQPAVSASSTARTKPFQSRYCPPKKQRSVSHAGRINRWPGSAGNAASSGQNTRHRKTKLRPQAISKSGIDLK